MGAADLGGLDRLAVDAPSRGGGVPARLAADLGSEGVVEGRPGAVVTPADEVVVDGPPGREVVGQGPPGAAVAVAVEDGVDDLAEAVLAWPTEGLGPGEQGLEDRPLGVGQVARIGLGFHPLTTSEFHFWNRL